MFPVVEICFPLQEHKAVVHESPALRGRERSAQALANLFDGGVGHLEHVEFVNDNDGLRQTATTASSYDRHMSMATS